MDTETIARKLEPLKPKEVRNWQRARDGADSELKDMLDKQIVFLAYKALGDFRNKILLSLPPEKMAKGEINLGTVQYEKEKWPLGLSRNELMQNMAIFGRSGAGKTNLTFHILEELVSRKIPFLFLDWKRTVRHLIPRVRKKINIFTPGRSLSPFPFNPFIPPPGLEKQVYINLVVDIMADAFTLGDGSKSVLQKAISACYKENPCPTAKDILKIVEKMPGKGRAGGWIISTVRALETIASSGIASEGNISQEELADILLKENTVVELDALSQGGKKFLIPLLCLWLYYVEIAETNRERLKLVIFVEEAHHVLYKQEHKAKESAMNMLLRQCREIGIGIVVVDQHPHLISSAALGNTYTSICLNQKDPTDINKAAALSLVESADKKYFSMLPVGQGVVKLQDRFRKPFLVQFPHVDVQKGFVTDHVLFRYLQENKSGSGWNTRISDDLGQVRRIRWQDKVLNEVELAFMSDVMTFLDDGVKQRYQRLAISAFKGNNLKKDLIREGWLEDEIVPIANTRKVLLRPSKKAREFFNLPPGQQFTGSLTHEYWKRHYARLYREKGYRVETEAPRVGGRVDVLAEKDGKRIAIEIETGKSDIVSNIKNCLRSGAHQVLVVITEKKALRKVISKLAKEKLIIRGKVYIGVGPSLQEAVPPKTP